MSYYDPIISFRISEEQYAALRRYAEQNKLSISETVRRAIRWMMILYQDKESKI